MQYTSIVPTNFDVAVPPATNTPPYPINFVGNNSTNTPPMSSVFPPATTTTTVPHNQQPNQHYCSNTNGTTTTLPHQQPPPPQWAPAASVPGLTFPTGLALRSTPRPDNHVSYENNRIIVPRDKRGSSDKERVKMHEICTEAIAPRITRGNIAKLLTSTDDSYDIAADAAQWQSALNNIWEHVVRFDYTHIVYIPTSFDPTNPTSFGNNSTFVNSVLDHAQLTDNHYFSWQTLIRRFANEKNDKVTLGLKTSCGTLSILGSRRKF